MRRAYRYAILGLLLVGVAAFSWQTGHSQTNDAEFFPETRHFVQGEFFRFYHAITDPELVYGYPLTEAFINSDGVRVQYFHRARFEMQPNGQVALTPLGSELYKPGNPSSNYDTNPATCRSFDTGFQVCMDFLAFYDAHGGLGQFGQPISRPENEGMRVVQYFEYARLEWHPETTDPRLDVQLGDLGWHYFHHLGENQARFHSPIGLNVIDITSLRVHAFPAQTTTQPGESLSIFIIVQDQAFTAVEGVDVIMVLKDEAGNKISYQVKTNSHGFSELALAIKPGGFSAGKVTIDATAAYAGLSKSTRTSFRVIP